MLPQFTELLLSASGLTASPDELLAPNTETAVQSLLNQALWSTQRPAAQCLTGSSRVGGSTTIDNPHATAGANGPFLESCLDQSLAETLSVPDGDLVTGPDFLE